MLLNSKRLIMGSILTAVILVVVGSAVSLFLSNRMLMRLIPEVLAELEKSAGIKARFSDISVGLLRGVSIDGLQLVIDRPELNGSVEISKTELRYSLLSLLAKKVVLSRLELGGIKAAIVLETGKRPKTEAKPFGREELYQMFKSLPVDISIRTLRLVISEVTLDLRDPLATVKLGLGKTQLDTAIAIGKETLSIDGRSAIETSALSVELFKNKGIRTGKAELSFSGKSRFDFGLRLRKEGNAVSIIPSIKTLEKEIAVTDFLWKPRDPAGTISINAFSYSVLASQALTAVAFKGRLKIAGLGLPSLKQSFDLSDSFEGTLEFLNRALQLRNQVTVQDDLLSDVIVRLKDTPKKLLIAIDHKLSVSQKHASIFGMDKQIQKLGGVLNAEASNQGEIEHGLDSLISDFGNIANQQIRVHLQPKVDVLPIHFGQISFGGANMGLTVDSFVASGLRLSEVRVRGHGRIEASKVGIEEKVPVLLFQEGAALDLEARYSPGEGLRIGRCTFATPSKSMVANISGGGAPNNLNISADASIRLLKRSAGTSGSGRVGLEARLIQSAGSHFSLRGLAVMDEVSIESDQFGVRGVAARIPFEEDLKISGMGPRFRKVIIQNPFERVDYNGIRNYLAGFPSNFEIREFSILGHEVGPLIANVQLRQNMALVNTYDLSALKGKVAGGLYFNLNEMEAGVLVRLTGFDPSELLPASKRMNVKSSVLSGRAALQYKIDHSMLEGRVDVTDIGQQQLITLINVLDPEFKNEQMNKVRFALKLAYPKYVGMRFYQGSMDIDVEFGGTVNLSIPIRGVPIGPMLKMIIEQMKEKEGVDP